jgi:hypothetical protein
MERNKSTAKGLTAAARWQNICIIILRSRVQVRPLPLAIGEKMVKINHF